MKVHSRVIEVSYSRSKWGEKWAVSRCHFRVSGPLSEDWRKVTCKLCIARKPKKEKKRGRD